VNEEQGRIRVMLVDDHATFREPLAMMLGWEPDLEVVAQAGSLARAREVLETENPAIDVAVVDLDLPDGSGVDLMKELHEGSPGTKLLVLSSHSEQWRLAGAVEAGAAGLMHKSAGPAEVVGAIRRLYSGEQLLSQNEVIEALRFITRERTRNDEARRMIEKLTSRELEIIQGLAEGLSDREMAEKLSVVPGTIRAHLTSILTKLEVDSRLQVLLFAVRYGLVEIE
jgi:DNA-binding NarL/FixJ family response regulator